MSNCLLCLKNGLKAQATQQYKVGYVPCVPRASGWRCARRPCLATNQNTTNYTDSTMDEKRQFFEVYVSYLSKDQANRSAQWPKKRRIMNFFT